MSAGRRRELVELVEQHQCECGGSAANMGLILEALERAGYKVTTAADDETDTAIAFAAEHSAPIRELIDRAIAGRGWALVVSADGLVTVIANSRRHYKRETVRRIMQMHRRGKGASAIARELSEAGVKTARGAETWHHETIRSIIERETSA